MSTLTTTAIPVPQRSPLHQSESQLHKNSKLSSTSSSVQRRRERRLQRHRTQQLFRPYPSHQNPFQNLHLPVVTSSPQLRQLLKPTFQRKQLLLRSHTRSRQIRLKQCRKRSKISSEILRCRLQTSPLRSLPLQPSTLQPSTLLLLLLLVLRITFRSQLLTMASEQTMLAGF